MTADCLEGGIDIWDTDMGNNTVIKDSVIVGRSKGNPGPEFLYNQSAGIMTSRNDGLSLRNISLFNFNSPSLSQK
jgi:hypothetical protein